MYKIIERNNQNEGIVSVKGISSRRRKTKDDDYFPRPSTTKKPTLRELIISLTKRIARIEARLDRCEDILKRNNLH